MQLLLLVYTSLPEQTQRDATIYSPSLSYLPTTVAPSMRHRLIIYIYARTRERTHDDKAVFL